MKMIRKIYRHISIRLIAFSLICIIPVNLLAVGLTSLIANVYQEKLMDSYENQLDLYMKDLDMELQYWKNSINEFLSLERVSILTLGPLSSESVEFYKMHTKLKEMRETMRLDSIGYLIDHKTGDAALSFHMGSYSLEETSQIQALVESDSLPEACDVEFSIMNESGKAWLVRNYPFSRYSFGVMLDIQEILERISGGMGEEAGLLYWVGQTGAVYASLSESDGFRIVEDMRGENMDGIPAQRGWVYMESISYGVPYKVVSTMEEDKMAESVPLLVKWLRTIALCSLLLIPLLGIFVRWLVLRPLKSLQLAMRQIEQGNLEYRLIENTGSDQMDYIYDSFNQMAREIKTLTIEGYEKEIGKLLTDSINMRLQVNPHMLLNSLSTIYGMAQCRNFDNIGRFTMHLIRYFRYVLRQDEELVPLKVEMEFVKDFLEIQKIRFPDSFTSVYAMEEGTEEVRIPRLLIENFVENSVKHGLVMGKEIEILVTIRRETDRLLIAVNDTGCGMDPEIREKLKNGEIISNDTGKHIGIWNCRRRMRLYYGDAAVLKITSTPGEGTQVFMELPAVPIDKEDDPSTVYKMWKEENYGNEPHDSG